MNDNSYEFVIEIFILKLLTLFDKCLKLVLFKLAPLPFFVIFLLLSCEALGIASHFFFIVLSLVLTYSLLHVDRLLVFFLHILQHLVKHEFASIELVRELKLVIKFLIAHSVKVKHYSIQMHDQSIWQIPDTLFLLNGDFLVTDRAVVVLDHFSSNHGLKRRLECLLILDGDLQRVEIFIGADDVAAVLADSQTGHLTLEGILAQVLLWGVFERLLETVKSHVQELLGILLHSHIDRLSVELLKREAEICRVILLTIRHLKEAEHL